MYTRKDYEFVADALHTVYDRYSNSEVTRLHLPQVHVMGANAAIAQLATEFSARFVEDLREAQEREYDRAERAYRDWVAHKGKLDWSRQPPSPAREFPKFDRDKFIARVRDGHNCTHPSHNKWET